MAGRIDYDIEKYQFTEAGETPRLREQWREVYLECRQLRAGAEERLRIALLNVDYVTSFELPFSPAAGGARAAANRRCSRDVAA